MTTERVKTILKNLKENKKKTELTEHIINQSGGINLNQYELTELSHKNKNIRSYVATHPQTPRKILERLIRDKDRDVRLNAITNPSIPANALTKLSTHPNYLIRIQVARHTKTPTPTLKKLVFDKNEMVGDEALANLRMRKNIKTI